MTIDSKFKSSAYFRFLLKLVGIFLYFILEFSILILPYFQRRQEELERRARELDRREQEIRNAPTNGNP